MIREPTDDVLCPRIGAKHEDGRDFSDRVSRNSFCINRLCQALDRLNYSMGGNAPASEKRAPPISVPHVGWNVILDW